MKFNCSILLDLFLWLALATIASTANWGAWSSWPVQCSTTCGPGVRCRRRQCVDGFGSPLADEMCSGTNVDCMSCVMSSQCPRKPGWSAWGDWNDCALVESNPKPKPNKHGCLPGTKSRSRKCNNPPPDPGPHSILCAGSSRDVKKCSYGCPDVPHLDDYNFKAKVTQIVQKDHLETRVRRKAPGDHGGVVLLRAPGGKVTFDCNTEAYNFAKATIEAQAGMLPGFSLPMRQVAVVWRRGGQDVVEKTRSRKGKDKRIIPPLQELVDEENEWLSGLQRSVPRLIGNQLILDNLRPHDTGFYTCHVSVDQQEWMSTFYSLIVLGQQFSAQAQMPFYLHSNVGEKSPFADANLHWYDAARLVWTLNGEEKFTDLLVRPRARIRRISSLNNSMQGQWNCHLVVPLPDIPTAQAVANITFSTRYLLNTFFLRVEPRPPSMWELAERPSRLVRLRLIALGVMTSSLVLLLGVLLTVWAVGRWVRKTPRLDQLECCVEEVVDDRTRLFLVAQKRARENRFLLMPYLRQEMRAIDAIRRNPPSQPIATVDPLEAPQNPVDDDHQTRKGEEVELEDEDDDEEEDENDDDDHANEAEDEKEEERKK